MKRIDIYPTHRYNGFKLRPGHPYPFGATLVPDGVNFSVYSSHATACTLVLFEKGAPDPLAEIPFPDEFRIGNVFAMIVFDLDIEETEYGYRMDGPWDPKNGHRFDPSQILLDPYAKAISGRDVWGKPHNPHGIYPHRALVVYDDFDWEDDRPLEIPIEDLIIYEMHVRGFTRHLSSGVKYPGTFAAIREKIPYLKELGVNALELMPVFEFDEFEYNRTNPVTGEPLINFWGYSSISFFAPKAGYAATGALTMQIDEFKTLVRELHINGIEVFLDVVFNHTAEGDHRGPTISFRGLDNKTYYMLTPEGYYYNFSGTGNTLNCNHPIVRDMVLDCLRYWVAEYHIDGFRFDLASILGRDQGGRPHPNPPLIETLAYDPILAKCKLIAEAWDAGGLYQVGSFPAYGRWAEWNGQYRDTVRRFLKGDEGQVVSMAQRILGSPDLYPERGPRASINFITAHDGFTLHDLVSYNEKHNTANGENNLDGANDNYSWNCGVEGPTHDPAINALRRRQIKNIVTMLMFSQGVPMILMGDEMAHTKHGNNNTYCHDNELNWIDWTRLETHHEIFNFFKQCIAFRKSHRVLRCHTHFNPGDIPSPDYAPDDEDVDPDAPTDVIDPAETGAPQITWHGTRAWEPDWSYHSRVLAFMLSGQCAFDDCEIVDDAIYVVMNMYWDAVWMELPYIGVTWRVFANTGMEPPHDIYAPGHEVPLEDQKYFLLGPRSVAILVGR